MGIANVYAALGLQDPAFEWLEQACQRRTGWLSMWVNGDPRLDSLRSDARMAGIPQRMGLRQFAGNIFVNPQP